MGNKVEGVKIKIPDQRMAEALVKHFGPVIAKRPKQEKKGVAK